MTEYAPQTDSLHRELMQMLPRFYDDSPEVDGLLYADAVEIERVRAEARDLLTQLSATTATWGLSDWERVLELPPRPNSPAEIRRSRILAKLRGAAPATIANMLSIINTHIPKKNAKLVELPEPGVINVEFPLQNGVALKELNTDINTYKPAHLAFNVQGVINDTITMIGNEYSFEVPYLICNDFTTDDAKGLGVGLFVGGKSAEYCFTVPYLTCGEFYAKEAY